MDSSLFLPEITQRLAQNIASVIVGKNEVIEKVILSILCEGHILLEDIPGTGKTTLAKALAKSIQVRFHRVQFTPDLLPSDLTGINFFNQKQGEFEFRPGSLFTNILLADEINRATPRTQSSLLECMEEHQITVDGVTYPLEKPFFVVATQNPIEIQGTFPLPEAQLDRFFMRLSMGYPAPEYEKNMLAAVTLAHPLEQLESVASPEDILTAQQLVRQIKVGDAVKDYILRIVSATRNHEEIRLGVSPRGSIALMRAAQAKAGVAGRDYVLPDDVKAVCSDVLAHRIICRGHNSGQSAAAAARLIQNIVEQTAVPIE